MAVGQAGRKLMHCTTPSASNSPNGIGAAGRSFFAGSAARPIYVDCIAASAKVPDKLPVVMVHGGGHTGHCYLSTPDGREGWAEYFAKAGHDAYVVDWPGHGRSPPCEDLARLSTREI